MPFLPHSLKDLNGLPPAVADYFRKAEDGTFVPNIDPASGYTIEQVAPLRSAIEASRELVRRLKAKVRDYGYSVDEDDRIIAVTGEEAVDPIAARDAIRKVREGKVSDKSASEREQAMEAKFKADLERERSERDIERRNDDHDYLNDALTRILNDSGAPQASHALLMPHLRERVRVERENGKRHIIVLDDKGRARVSQKFGSAASMEPRELVDAMKVDRSYAALWPSKGNGGSGADHSSGGSARTGTVDPSDLSGPQLLALARGRTA